MLFSLCLSSLCNILFYICISVASSLFQSLCTETIKDAKKCVVEKTKKQRCLRGRAGTAALRRRAAAPLLLLHGDYLHSLHPTLSSEVQRVGFGAVGFFLSFFFFFFNKGQVLSQWERKVGRNSRWRQTGPVKCLCRASESGCSSPVLLKAQLYQNWFFDSELKETINSVRTGSALVSYGSCLRRRKD